MKGKRFIFTAGLIFILLLLSGVGAETQAQTEDKEKEAIREAREKVEAIKRKSQESIKEKIAELDAELIRLKNELASAKLKLKEEKEKRENLERAGGQRIQGGKIEELRQELFLQRDKAEKADRAGKAAEEKANKLEKELSPVKNELKAAQDTIEAKEGENESLVREKEGLLEAQAKMQEELSVEREKAAEANSSLEAAKKRLEALQAELVQIKIQLEATQRTTANQGDKSWIKEKEALLKSQAGIQEELSVERKKAAETNTALEAAKKRLEALQAELGQIKMKKEVAKTTTDKEKEGVLESQAKIQEELSIEREKTRKMGIVLEVTEKNLKAIQIELAQTKKELAAQQKTGSGDMETTELKDLQIELAQTKKELAAAQQKTGSGDLETTEVKDLRTELAQTKKELVAAQQGTRPGYLETRELKDLRIKTEEALAARAMAEARIEKLTAELAEYKALLSAIKPQKEVIKPEPEGVQKPELEPVILKEREEPVVTEEKKTSDLDEALKDLKDKKVEIIKGKDMLIMVPPILFSRSGVAVEPVYFDILDGVAEVIKLYPRAEEVIIKGYIKVDEVGKEPSFIDFQLSKARAENVMKYLIDNGNISSRLLSSKSSWGSESIISSKIRERFGGNQWVEVVILTGY
ncbi:MAG: OmpA family protein [bacterium]|nr:OmpA family protein [bacterium]